MGFFDFLKKKPIIIGKTIYLKCIHSKPECQENTSIGQHVNFYPREPHRITLILKGSIIGEWSEINDEVIYNHLKKDGQLEAKVSEIHYSHSMMELTLIDKYISEAQKEEITRKKVMKNLSKRYKPKSKFKANFFCEKGFDTAQTYTLGCNKIEKVNPSNIRKSIWLIDENGNRLSYKNDTYQSECEKILKAYYSDYKLRMKFESLNNRGGHGYSASFTVEPFIE